MTEIKLDTVRLGKIFKSHPEVRLVYLFGSQAAEKTGPLSDYDFAVFLDNEISNRQMFDVKFMLQDKLSRELKTDKIDIVILNLTQGPELKYNIIKSGKLIYEIEPYRLLLEPIILNSYFDFIYSLRRYNLTKA